MKNICIIINHFQVTDGVARAAIGVANALCKKDDINVTIIPLFRYDSQMLEKLDKRVKVKPVFRCYFKGMAKLVDLIPDRVLYKLIVREKYDIEIGFCMILPSKIIASSSNKEALHYVWMHGYDDDLVLRDYYLKADKVVSVSKYNADRLMSDIPELKRVDVCYNLIDDSDVISLGNVECEQQRNDTHLLAVTVGRQSSEKGYGRLIDCIYKLKQAGKTLNLWMIGNGDEHQNLVNKVKEYRLEEQVVFLGEQKNPHKFTLQADFFICSSYSEGYSTACTEAIILGVPVVSTKVSGAEEIVSESEAGMVVENKDEALYLELLNIIDNPGIISEWKESLEKTRNRFFKDSRENELYNVLELRN